jgi:predicted  nucleic acid-binding Zn-ribbon protein
MDLKVQYQVLTQIKNHDEQIFSIKKELTQIPIDKKALDSQLQAKKDEYLGHKATLEGYEKQARKLEQDLKDKEDRIKKSESKMMEVKTNEEYKAALKEVETQKQENSVFEDQILVLMNNIDKERESLKTVEVAYKGHEKEINQKIQVLLEHQKSIEKKLQDILEIKKENLKQLASDSKSMYEKVSAYVQGVPIVFAESAMCQGCRVKLRPQQFNEIIGFVSIFKCTNCSKLLIPNLEKLVKDEKSNPVL